MEAFNILKRAVLSAPFLVYPDPKKEYILETNALLGAVLSQCQDDGKYHPVTFASQTLLPVEMRYHSMKLEFLTMMCHFILYLMGKKFKVKTNNNPLVYFMTSLNLDAMKHRWIGKLAPYDVSVENQKGKLNVVPDVLSHMMGRLSNQETDSYLSTVEGNPLEDQETDFPKETSELGDEPEHDSLWPPMD